MMSKHFNLNHVAVWQKSILCGEFVTSSGIALFGLLYAIADEAQIVGRHMNDATGYLNLIQFIPSLLLQLFLQESLNIHIPLFEYGFFGTYGFLQDLDEGTLLNVKSDDPYCVTALVARWNRPRTRRQYI